MFLQFYRDYECDIFDICYEHGCLTADCGLLVVLVVGQVR